VLAQSDITKGRVALGVLGFVFGGLNYDFEQDTVFYNKKTKRYSLHPCSPFVSKNSVKTCKSDFLSWCIIINKLQLRGFLS